MLSQLCSCHHFGLVAAAGDDPTGNVNKEREDHALLSPPIITDDLLPGTKK